MLKSRELLEREISNALNLRISKRRELQRLIKEARDKFGMPEKISSDFIHMSKNIIEADTFTLFILTDILFGSEKINEFFTNMEVKELSRAKWHIEKSKGNDVILILK